MISDINFYVVDYIMNTKICGFPNCTVVLIVANYCADHRCLYMNCSRPRSMKPNASYCDEDTCIIDNCVGQKYSQTTPYCVIHLSIHMKQKSETLLLPKIVVTNEDIIPKRKSSDQLRGTMTNVDVLPKRKSSDQLRSKMINGEHERVRLPPVKVDKSNHVSISKDFWMFFGNIRTQNYYIQLLIYYV